ncbi:hypothetical protein [Paucibacter sp. Y2R2-4]|uniref:hypothetical protein n=1 Tax=Paucibacter sp. Y2R2-4 TaxID=2893553 RepID=UPI0021E41F06|nr:hypothetical protein [Paucibacter sp. Y2R2-4]MCV2350467.1 hypothetical protein [Paucibacter sp. Y2R2-4]
MKHHLISALLTGLVGAVWGYFADLQQGEVAWFYGRILFCAGFGFMSSYLRRRGNSTGRLSDEQAIDR